MYPVLLDLGKVHLYTYGLFVALGLMTAIWISKRIAKPHGISPDTITDIFIVILVSAIVGARLLYVAINFSTYKDHPLEMLKIWNGGLVFFGGFIVAAAAAAVYFNLKNLKIWKMADIISPGIALGHAVGRIGCLFAGCCYGKACDLPFAIKFTHPESLAPLGVYLHPTQMYSIFSNLILFFILMGLHKKKKFDGMIFLSYIMLYSLFRSIIEFFRGDFRGDFFFEFISMSQGIGLLVFLMALILLTKLSKSSHGPE